VVTNTVTPLDSANRCPYFVVRPDFTGRTPDFYTVEANIKYSKAQYIFVNLTIKVTCCIRTIYIGDTSNR